VFRITRPIKLIFATVSDDKLSFTLRVKNLQLSTKSLHELTASENVN